MDILWAYPWSRCWLIKINSNTLGFGMDAAHIEKTRLNLQSKVKNMDVILR